MSDFVIDASAWVEYFNGTNKGEKIKNIVENPNNQSFTNIITIAELVSSYTRRALSFENEKKSLLALSSIFNINFEFTEEAGKLHASLKKERKNISLADTFVLLTAKKLNATVVTSDNDFKGLKEVILI